MDFFMILTIGAFVAVLISLSGGILAMVNGGEIGHKNETQWMVRRVGWQAVALVFVLLATLARN